SSSCRAACSEEKGVGSRDALRGFYLAWSHNEDFDNDRCERDCSAAAIPHWVWKLWRDSLAASGAPAPHRLVQLHRRPVHDSPRLQHAEGHHGEIQTQRSPFPPLGG